MLSLIVLAPHFLYHGDSHHKYNFIIKFGFLERNSRTKKPFHEISIVYFEGIKTMLEDYINHKHVKLDMDYFAERLYFYTSGYPFLVSKLCKIIDEKIMTQDELKWEKAAKRMIDKFKKNKNPKINGG